MEVIPAIDLAAGRSRIVYWPGAASGTGVPTDRPDRIAEQLVIQTIRGSIAYYEKSTAHPAPLRNQVTSPGGTSAEALYYLEKAGFRTAISRAVWAAFQRSLELGREQPVHIPKENE